eukprot:3508103-Amphidinium_carterae.1
MIGGYASPISTCGIFAVWPLGKIRRHCRCYVLAVRSAEHSSRDLPMTVLLARGIQSAKLLSVQPFNLMNRVRTWVHLVWKHLG